MEDRYINEKDKIKEIYDLKYDPSEYSLSIWYNALIDKSIAELNSLDIYRMLTQRLLVDLAIDKAIEHLSVNPFVGYFWDGQFLELILKEGSVDLKKSINYSLLNSIIAKAEEEYMNYDWLDIKNKEKFLTILNEFKIKVQTISKTSL